MEPAVGPPLSLELTSSSLGPFTLGSTVFAVLDYLRTSGKALFPWVQVKYDPACPATSPIHIHLLPLPGILLIFPTPSQRLSQIHVLSLPSSPNLTLLYSTRVLASPTKPLTRGDVGRIFGPTFDSEESGELWYPGLGFGCEETGGSGAARGREQRVARVHVCQKEEMGGSVEVVKRKMKGDELMRAVIPTSQQSLQLHFSSSPPLTIAINETTVSDLLADLGPPTRTFIKEDFRMTVHREQDDAEGPNDQLQGSYFVNYIQYGADFLIAPRTHRVLKIILHSNLPGAIQFGRYERCPWEFAGDEGADPPSLSLSVTTKV